MRSLSIQAVMPVHTSPISGGHSSHQDWLRALTQAVVVRVQPSAMRLDAYSIEVCRASPPVNSHGVDPPSPRLPASERLRAQTQVSEPPLCSSAPASRSLSPLLPVASLLPAVPVEASKLIIRCTRSFVGFFDLQLQLQQCTRVAHSTMPCEFCREVNSAAVWGGPHSSPLAVFTMDREERATAFDSAINGLLQLTKTRFSMNRRSGPCAAEQEIRSLLAAFLFG
ncbi:hypothetical protein PybrP1_006453 [[Pythium] brassicae (nom. inval.)]|nr:hypothetical protein PybrP1_006453 [[Pythium] brassicae (nom. inval.)]